MSTQAVMERALDSAGESSEIIKFSLWMIFTIAGIAFLIGVL